LQKTKTKSRASPCSQPGSRQLRLRGPGPGETKKKEKKKEETLISWLLMTNPTT
jgi:hypothetical protein